MTLQYQSTPKAGATLGKRLKVETKKKKGMPVTSKDFSLSIFNALGKFLYNKRITSSKEPEAVPFTKMKSPTKRPVFYESHAEVLAQNTLEPSQI